MLRFLTSIFFPPLVSGAAAAEGGGEGAGSDAASQFVRVRGARTFPVRARRSRTQFGHVRNDADPNEDTP